MFKIPKFLLISLFVVLSFSASLGAKYKCEITGNGKICSITGLQLTRDDYRIEPEAEDLNGFEIIHLFGNVPIISSGICDAFPNLKGFFAAVVNAEEIEENSFQGCKNLRVIELSWNKFIKFERNTLRGLSNLTRLRLGGGKNVSIIDLDLTDSKQLIELKLCNLNISELSTDVISEQKNLEELQLWSNNLFDLNVEAILQYAPHLQVISLADNNFKCTRLREILSVLRSKNITSNTYAYPLRRRSYRPEMIDGVHCLNDLQWESELAKFPLKTRSFYKNQTSIDEGLGHL